MISPCCLPGGYLSLILGKVSEPKKASSRSSEVHSCGWGWVQGHTMYVARKRSQWIKVVPPIRIDSYFLEKNIIGTIATSRKCFHLSFQMRK